MFSPVLFRFSKPKSCLVFLFFLSSFQKEVTSCNTLFKCGNITAGFPFWGEARPQPCGHPSLGLRCQKSTNFTYLIISELIYRVLLNVTATTLKLARQDFLGGFCNASFSGATLTPELFELLPDYKTLSANYQCDPSLHYPSNFTCPPKGVGLVHAHQNDDYHGKCGVSFNITVPTSYAPEEKALNITHLESVFNEGFEVKLKIDDRPCQVCKSTGGICAYDAATPVCCRTNSTSEIKCTHMIPPPSSGSKRAIVYEFLKNGSLDQFLSKKKPLGLDVTTLYEIALGLARGLEYLHHGCKTRTVHFDIKPQNVLLDDNLCPKVSDFGVAKLCEKRESIMSLLYTRGTIGYIAPEPCPLNRPLMNRVVEMMEGSLDALEVPPKPSMQISTMALSESSCLSEVKSNNSEELI
ncbi:unnamed protein product [Microthlaspi erraticum]|uniref:non-specific serine/threonine protein kinase n=1 Tax=Microthlaspi erraticum TaxID=1685480 RepID=A0A6D2KU19_9BRAS|nr:unnamed protein product [Microthlaspi erraticum]